MALLIKTLGGAVALCAALAVFGVPGQGRETPSESEQAGGGVAATGRGGEARESAEDNTAATSTGVALPSVVPRKFSRPAPSNAIFRNPERGFYRATNIIDESTLSWIEDRYSLYFSYVRLDDYRTMDIPAGFLTEVDDALAKVRAEGAKVILRFAYNLGPYPGSEPDASLAQILSHIEQLGPVLRDNVDVIATLQAGFIGAWGEWHTSSHGLDNIEDKTTVLNALLEELPVSRTVQIRYPPDLMGIYGDAPLSEGSAWSGTAHSRTGDHNDCFLAGERDTGTYPTPTNPEVFKAYLAQHNLFVPMGGETCAPSPPRSECLTALAEMKRLRFSFVNDDYHPDVLASWTAEGCRGGIERLLGYRLQVNAVDVPEAVAPGDPFIVSFDIENVGWAAPMNPRPVFLILRQGKSVHRLLANGVEMRSWLPGSTTTILFRGILPDGSDAGEIDVGLWFPDESATLALDPRYSIQLANEGVWEPETGTNHLATWIVSEHAETDTVPGAVAMDAGWN